VAVWQIGIATIPNLTAPPVCKAFEDLCPPVLESRPYLDFETVSLDIGVEMHGTISIARCCPSIHEAAVSEDGSHVLRKRVLVRKRHVLNETQASNVLHAAQLHPDLAPKLVDCCVYCLEPGTDLEIREPLEDLLLSMFEGTFVSSSECLQHLEIRRRDQWGGTQSIA
jgi:hypothetical protein